MDLKCEAGGYNDKGGVTGRQNPRPERVGALGKETEVDERPDIGQPLPVSIAEWIAEQILAGNIAPGEHLKEGDFAERFHTSRAPIREAFYLLQLDGLIERQPRRGTVVRVYSEEDVRELYQTRTALERLAIERLQERWSTSWLDTFGSILATMAEAIKSGDYRSYSEENSKFHTKLMEYGGGTIIYALWRQITSPLKYLVRASTRSPDEMEASFEEHRLVVTYMEQGDFEGVARVLTQNIHHGMTRVLTDRSHQGRLL